MTINKVLDVHSYIGPDIDKNIGIITVLALTYTIKVRLRTLNRVMLAELISL